MNVSHHLDDATLVRYASGDLDEAFSVVVAAHLAMCPDCRRAARDAEEMGGQFLSGGEAAEMDEGAFDALMNRLDGEGGDAPATAASAVSGDVPLPLQRFIGTSLDEVHWRSIAPGVRKHAIKLPKSSSKLYMLYIGPGLAMPEHGHGGSEMTLVLSGAYRDDMGIFQAGDIADLDEHVEHQPRVHSDDPCICLVATEAPTRFKGIVGKLLQPIVGI